MTQLGLPTSGPDWGRVEQGDAKAVSNALFQLWNLVGEVKARTTEFNSLMEYLFWRDTTLVLRQGNLRFPAIQNPSTDVNVLDDYEEGSFTPAFGGSTSESGQVYGTQVGCYIKVGKLVFVLGRLQLSTLGTITGNVRIQGFPFATANIASLNPVLNIGSFANLTTSVVRLSGTFSVNATSAELRMLTAAATGTSAMAQADLSNTTDMAFSGFYQAAN